MLGNRYIFYVKDEARKWLYSLLGAFLAVGCILTLDSAYSLLS